MRKSTEAYYESLEFRWREKGLHYKVWLDIFLPLIGVTQMYIISRGGGGGIRQTRFSSVPTRTTLAWLIPPGTTVSLISCNSMKHCEFPTPWVLFPTPWVLITCLIPMSRARMVCLNIHIYFPNILKAVRVPPLFKNNEFAIGIYLD